MQQPWIIWYAITLHLYWGITTIVSDAAGKGFSLFHLRGIFDNHYLLGSVLIAVAVSSTVGLVKKQKWWILLVLPQQLALMVAAAGAVAFVLAGEFAVGTSAPRIQIAGAMVTSIAAAVFHTIAILDHIGVPWKRFGRSH